MPYLGSTPNASFSSRTKQDFTANGSTTAFTLSSAVASPNDIEVFVGNVRQEPTDAYTVNGTTLTMSAAPANGVNFYVVFKQLEENSVVPADGTISSGKLAPNAVTTAKLDDSAGGLTLPGTQYARVPVGTTAQRPGSPANGMLRYNSTLDVTEEYRNGQWRALSNVMLVTGGTITTSGAYTIHTFTSSGTFTVDGGSLTGVDYLVVAGGGGGGSRRAGGGGGGGMVNATNQSISAGTYTITIGAGGAGATTDTNNGVIGGNTAFGSIQTCGGGGYGGGEGKAGGGGGSGGGGSDGQGGGAGTSGQGNAGGGSTGSTVGGGGGGKGAAGSQSGNQAGGNGGGGLTLAYSGSSVAYAGGGGGGSRDGYSGGSGASGGGTGGVDGSTVSTAGAANRGGGGGGGGRDGGGPFNGANGGSGVVVIRYIA